MSFILTPFFFISPLPKEGCRCTSQPVTIIILNFGHMTVLGDIDYNISVF